MNYLSVFFHLLVSAGPGVLRYGPGALHAYHDLQELFAEWAAYKRERGMTEMSVAHHESMHDAKVDEALAHYVAGKGDQSKLRAIRRSLEDELHGFSKGA